MNVIEKRYRLITIQERIEQLEAELAVIAEDEGTPPVEADRLMTVQWHLRRGVHISESVSFSSNPDDLTKILEASIDSVRSLSAAKVRAIRRCGVFGADDQNNAG